MKFYQVVDKSRLPAGIDLMEKFVLSTSVYFCTVDKMKSLVRECFDNREKIDFINLTTNDHSYEGCKISSWSEGPEESKLNFTIDDQWHYVEVDKVITLGISWK